MAKNKMTIHRALSELKMIDSRIEKGIDSISPSGFYQTGNLVNHFVEQSVFEKSAKANFQSVQDLIERKNVIKSAVVYANSITDVIISGKKMKIADAINLKSSMPWKKRLVHRLLTEHNQVKSSIEKHNTEVDANALRLAQAALQKDNVKINDGDAISITEPFIEKKKFRLFDPMKAEKLIEDLQTEIEDFETEVDAALSEINAITIIEV